MIKENPEEEALLQDFIIEAEEHLEDIEEKVVELEKRGTDEELINSVFRAFHTIKGNARWLELDPVVKLAHAAESLLGDLRNKRLDLSSSIIDTILKVRDTTQQIIDQLKSEEEMDTDITHIISLIEEERKGAGES